MIAKFQSGASQIRDSTPQSSLPSMEFGREICCSLANAEQHEWLVTNGIGGYASGTVAGLTTRRYHGLLIAALKPPLGRTPLVAKIAVVDACARHLLTSYGLRSLASGHADSQGHYAGGPRERDAAYHQGTVWAGCSAHLFLRICVCATTQPELPRFSSRLQIMCVAMISARPVKSLTATRPLLPGGASPRLGRLVNFSALGGPQPLQRRGTRRR